jgi:hypothetical protein
VKEKSEMRNLYKVMLATPLLALQLLAGPVLGQQNQTISNPAVIRTQLAPIQRLGVVNMQEAAEMWDPVFKTVEKIHVPGIDARKDQVRLLKAEANRIHEKLVNEAQGSDAVEKTAALWPPTLGTNFFGNSYGGGDPADNALAVSAAGNMISGNNTRLHTYTETGTQTGANTFTQFASAGGVSTNFTFDPKCTYDPVEDRFVVAFLNGGSSNSTKVIIAFSQTNDPSGSWNVYSINGNVNNLGVWTDFVQIGLNANELFVTGNPFTNAGSSQGAVIWQINKTEGFTGASLNPVQHYVPGSFSLHPVQGGATLYGPNMFFLESSLGTSNSITLHQITNSIANNGVLNAGVGFTLDNSYTISPDADQKGTTINLRTNDTRVQSSYFENSRIEFVLNSSVNGRAGIYHGSGQIVSFALSFSSFTGRTIGFPDLDIAYPSIAYAGQTDLSGVNHSYISYNVSGANFFPGMAAVYSDENGYSAQTVIKEGVSYINSADDRWGDYSGLDERAGHPGEVWAAGTMGNASRQQRTYIAQLLPPQAVANEPIVLEPVKMQVFPNPTTELVKFTFPVEVAGEYKVEIHDIQGKLVKLLVQDWLAAGKAMLSFNAAYLPAGTYNVTVRNEDIKLFSEKLVVTH